MKLFELHETEFDEEKFEKDCSFYLEQLGDKAKSLHMYRGMRKNDGIINKIKGFRERAHSVSMPPGVHSNLNKLLDKMFGHPYRNGLFTTGSRNTAFGYGNGDPKIIVPVGKFEWLCAVDVHDLYGEYASMRDEYGHDRAADDILDLVEKADWKSNTDLPMCLESKAEITLWCPNGYYVFDPEKFLPRAIK